MAEYIEREALQKRLKMHQVTNPTTIGKKQFREGYYLGLSETEIMVAQAPKADVAPVRHGLRYRTGEIRACAGLVEIQCSECEETNLFDVIRYKTSARYCPYCGAKWERGAYNG